MNTMIKAIAAATLGALPFLQHYCCARSRQRLYIPLCLRRYE